jgi:PAS domain S-box-containing protein
VLGQLRELALAESEERYRKLVEVLPDAVVVHRDGRFVFVNPAAVRLMRATGPDDLLGKGILDVVHPDFHELVLRRVRREIADGLDVPAIEERFIRLDGTEMEVEVMAAAITYEGRPAGLVVVRDITERKRAEEEVLRSQRALAEAEARYRALVEHVPAVIYIWDFHEGTGRAAYVSPQIEDVLGFAPEAFVADPMFWFERTHAEDRDAVIAETTRSVEAGEPFEMEYRMLDRQGRVVWVRDHASALLQAESGRVLIHQGVLVDITESVRLRDEIRSRLDELRRLDADRRRLLARLVAAQEDERRRIATNIHDDPVQKITAAVARLDIVAAAHPEVAADERYRAARRSVRDSINSLRHLMFEVHPPSLERDGDLEAALRTMTAAEASEHPRTSFEVRWNARSALPREIATVLYRIAQEALVNARKHSGASRVVVSVTDSGDGIRLRIEDDGVGFSADAAGASPPGHIGLTSMRERAEIAGGTLLVRSGADAGICVEARLPL